MLTFWKKLRCVAIVLTLRDHRGEIVDIVDLPPDITKANLDAEIARARKLPRVRDVDQHAVHERPR